MGERVTVKVLNKTHSTLGVAGSTLPITPASGTNIKQYIDQQIAVTTGWVYDDFTAAAQGGATLYTVSTPPIVVNSEYVIMNGLIQTRGSAYTVVGNNQIQLTYTPTAGDVNSFIIRYVSEVP